MVIHKHKEAKTTQIKAFRTYSHINMPYDDEYESLIINICLSSGRRQLQHENHMPEIGSFARSKYCVKSSTLQNHHGDPGVYLN